MAACRDFRGANKGNNSILPKTEIFDLGAAICIHKINMHRRCNIEFPIANEDGNSYNAATGSNPALQKFITHVNSINQKELIGKLRRLQSELVVVCNQRWRQYIAGTQRKTPLR